MQTKAKHQNTDVKWLYSRVLQVPHDLISINKCIRNYKSCDGKGPEGRNEDGMFNEFGLAVDLPFP